MTLSLPSSFLRLVGSVLLLAGTSCTQRQAADDPAPSLQTIYYEQTQCADKWGQATTTAQLVDKATAYLAQQGIPLNQANATNTGMAAACAACTCRTGFVLQGKVAQADLAGVLALGFHQ